MALGVFGTLWTPKVGHFGYLIKYRKYGIHKTPPSLAPGYPAKSKVPIGWLDGDTMAIEPDMLPKHPRDEARNASGAGRHHHFWHLPYLELQLCSGNIRIWALGWPRCYCPPKDRAVRSLGII